MSDQRNLILAIALSLVVLLSFQYFYELPRIEQQEAQQSQQEQLQESRQGGRPEADRRPGAAVEPGAAVQPSTPSTEPTGSARKSGLRETALAKVARLPIRSARLHGSIPVVGRRIDDLVLSGYKVSQEPGSPDVTLFSPAGSPAPYYASFGWASGESDTALPDDDTAWRVRGDELGPGRKVVLEWDNGQGLTFRRIYELDENYMFTISQSVENRADRPVTLSPWGLVSRTGTPDVLGFYILHEGPIGVLGETLHEIDYDDIEVGREGDIAMESRGGWLGITDKYWLAALVPDQKQRITGTFRHRVQQETDSYQVDYLGPAVTVPAGGSAEAANRLFAGAKEVKLLDAYEARYEIPLFDRAVDFGWFYFLTKPFFYVLDYFNRILGNFGLAILLFTVCVKLIFFPLANKSYKAMSRMKALQPKMAEIKEKYGDDRQKMNQAMMTLYKEEKVNPASGCLPIAIQIPVFFALYKVLFVTIEMRHAPFYGWIKDLSAPDPLTVFNLFGLIPWDPPQFLAIGIWPILMGLSMFLQMKLNPQPADPVQAKVFMFMPLFFTFLLAAFPAGLVIYWTWNNVLSMAQQYVIMKRMGVPIGGKAPAGGKT